MAGYSMRKRRAERGIAFLLALVGIVVLTSLGLALLYVTNTERIVAGNEGRVAKSLYAADAGVEWAAARMGSPQFFASTTFQAVPPGTVQFAMPDHMPSESSGSPNIAVAVSRPLPIARLDCLGCAQNKGKKQYKFAFQIQVSASDTFLQASKTILADVEVGPLVAPIPKSGF